MSNYLIWIILSGIILFILWVIFTYNHLVKLRNRVKEAWSDILVQLKRRYNLIPNLVETVKGYARHEREIFEKISETRAKAMKAEDIHEKARLEGELTRTLRTLFAIAENYPDLKASENFAKLQDELQDTEDKIQYARRFYNGNVREYNTKIESFPSNIIAKLFGFKKAEFFELEREEEKEPVKVEF